MTTQTLQRQQPFPARVFVLVGGSIALAFAVVQFPGLSVGLVGGMLLLLLVLTQPLSLIALMLVIGPVNLSFLTGGMKALFPEAGGLDMNGIRLVGVTAGFLALWLVDRRVQRHTFGPSGRWYAVFLFWAGASLLTSLDPLEGLRLLLKLAYPLLTFVAVAGMVEREEQLDTLMWWTLAAGVAIALIIHPTLVASGVGILQDGEYRRIQGLANHQNPFSFYLMVILLISYTRFILRGQYRYLALCAVLAFWIYVTYTRITLLGLFAGVAAITVYAALAGRKYRAVAAGVLMMAGLGLTLLPKVLERSLGYAPSPIELVRLMSSPSKLYLSINWQGRQVIWPAVYTEFRSDPWTGLGMGSSSAVLRKYFPDGRMVVHNEYLRLGVDIGIIGVGLFFIAMIAWLAAAIRVGWRGSTRVREYALPAIGVIIGWAMISITDNPFDYYAALTQYAGFLTAGALVAKRLEDGQQLDSVRAP
jgi:O-antigen ligase